MKCTAIEAVLTSLRSFSLFIRLILPKIIRRIKSLATLDLMCIVFMKVGVIIECNSCRNDFNKNGGMSSHCRTTSSIMQAFEVKKSGVLAFSSDSSRGPNATKDKMQMNADRTVTTALGSSPLLKAELCNFFHNTVASSRCSNSVLVDRILGSIPVGVDAGRSKEPL
jgi:hypothetical protein